MNICEQKSEVLGFCRCKFERDTLMEAINVIDSSPTQELVFESSISGYTGCVFLVVCHSSDAPEHNQTGQALVYSVRTDSAQ